MKKLNMEEKKKLERLVEIMLEESRAMIREEVNDVARQLSDKPVQAVTKLVKDIREHEEKLNKLRDGLKGQHYYFSYDNSLAVDSQHPILVEARKTEQEKIKKLNRLSNEFTVRIYSEAGGMEEILAGVEKSLREVILK